MNYKFIPVNNNLDKARAFANSLDNKFITNVQKIKQKDCKQLCSNATS